MEFDYLLVGGGLQNGLIVLALRHYQPQARIALIEQDTRLGGNHTWSFHQSDVSAELWELLLPLVVARWPEHEVRFPSFTRRLIGEYATISSLRFDVVVRSALGDLRDSILVTGNAAVTVARNSVTLQDGNVLRADAIIDARGPTETLSRHCGFQKFLGVELENDRPFGPTRPILMDATVEQHDGYRFVYSLPLAPNRLLVEDTYYSAKPHLDCSTLRGRLQDYLATQGWVGGRVLREETGVLPIPWRAPRGGNGAGPFHGGYRGNWFHPTTGYSLPVAARLAGAIGITPAKAFPGAAVAELAKQQRRQARFCHWLNWMLFRTYREETRWHVLERFYRLPESSIRRFYAMQMTRRDHARILCGTPPKGFSLRTAFSNLEIA